MTRKLGWLQPVLALAVVAVVAFLLRPQPAPPPPVAATPTPLKSPRALNAEQQYAVCCGNLEKMMGKLRQEYGPNGPVPMAAVQAVSMYYRCPASSSLGYSASGDGTMGNTILFCRGSNHKRAGVPDDFPDIHSQRGLNRGFDPEGKLGIPAPKI